MLGMRSSRSPPMQFERTWRPTVCFTRRTRARVVRFHQRDEARAPITFTLCSLKLTNRPHDKNLERRTGLKGTRLAVDPACCRHDLEERAKRPQWHCEELLRFPEPGVDASVRSDFQRHNTLLPQASKLKGRGFTLECGRNNL